MGLAKSNQIVYKITRIHRKHPWIRIYLLTLLVLIIWGNISTRKFLFTDYNLQNAPELSYENFAPGWASLGIIRAFLEPWQRWDTNFYLQIAKEGYSISGFEVAFPPLYPMFIRLVGILLGGQYLLAALLISWSALLGSCFLLEERFTRMTDQKMAYRGIRNLLIFPTAFFFFSAYTEALFLFLLLLAWRYADREQWLFAGVVGALATMTRFMGIILVLPFGWIWLQNWRKNKSHSFIAILLVPATYFGWGFLAERIYHIQPDMALSSGWALQFEWPWRGLLGSVGMIFSQQVFEVFFVYLDVLAVAIAGLSIFWWLKKKAIPEVIFIFGVTTISLMKIGDSGILISTSRYVLPLFPMYLVLAAFGEKPRFDWMILSISIILCLLYSGLFFTWNWVA